MIDPQSSGKSVDSITLAGLLYGDYPELAARFLHSIPKHSLVKEIRIGLNEVSDRVKRLFRDWADLYVGKGSGVVVSYWDSKQNTGKYRVMREMLHSSAYPVKSSHLMWFDDDSCFEQPTDAWWETLSRQAAGLGVVQVGRVHRIRQRGQQYVYIQQQPWYTGQAVDPAHKFTFATGGWWLADMSFLREHDYPSKDLYHNGGDSLLGEIIKQQGKVIVDWSEGLHCGCESCRKAGSGGLSAIGGVRINVGGRKGRRGMGVTDEYYVGSSSPPREFPVSYIRFGGVMIVA
jgi:hypothetical protein